MENASELSKNFTVYVPDLPGFGFSQPLIGHYHIPELAEFVDNFANHLGLENFHLVGHSLGGGIAIKYVLQFPQKVKKLVLVSSMCLGKEIAWWTRLLSQPTFVKSIMAVVTGVFEGVRWIVERCYSGIKLVLPFTVTSILIGSAMTTIEEQAIVFVNHLSLIMVPTLVVWGARDSIVPSEQAHAAAQLIPHCEVKIFEGSGHNVYKQRIDEFSQLVIEFLG
jgi:pimeloyl-ACP methyl ester carboxylesterase